MSDAVSHRIETIIRETTAFRHDTDPPDVEAHRELMAALDRERMNLQRQDALRLETLIERRTGFRKGAK